MSKLVVLATLISVAFAQIGPGVPDARCPPNATPNPPIHLSDPSDCGRFFTCANGLAVPFECPPGQHWSVADNRCDWPDRAQCQEGSSCPPGDPMPPVLLPHPSDCSRFLKCSWGVPVEMNCPPGQHWSVQHGWCDFPDRANCENGSTSTTRASGSTTTRASGSTSTVRSTTRR